MTVRVWHARTPDGREWEVRVRAFHVAERTTFQDENFLADVIGTHAAVVLVDYPLAAVRSIWSRTRYVEARCYWPAEIVVTWRTSRRLAARHARDIAEHLNRGYADVAPAGVEMVHMTRPPGFGDL